MSMSPPSANSVAEFGRPDVEGDARRMFEVLARGGVAIVRTGFSYGIMTSTKEGVDRINAAKQRGSHKRQGMALNYALSREIHILESWKQDMIDCAVLDYKLPLGVVARYRTDHPLIRKIAPEQLRLCTARDQLATVLNPGGPSMEPLMTLSQEHLLPLMGSSANISGTGVRHRIADIETEVLGCADLIVDQGIPEYHTYNAAGTLIDWDAMKVIRFGACYELLSDVFERHFGWQMPADPGRVANPSGHVDEFLLAEAD